MTKWESAYKEIRHKYWHNGVYYIGYAILTRWEQFYVEARGLKVLYITEDAHKHAAFGNLSDEDKDRVLIHFLITGDPL